MFQAIDICKAYHGQKVLDHVTLALPRGCCLGVVGPNGSGKSTLLSILAQTLPADSGDVLFRGKSVLGDRNFLRHKLGYVPQHSDLAPELTCRQQLKLWQLACGAEAAIPGYLREALGLEELMDIPIREMSGGMEKRVSIAMAMCTQPEILILDEVTSGLDDRYRQNLMILLEQFLAKGGRIVLCSHLPEETQRLCGSILPLKGR